MADTVAYAPDIPSFSPAPIFSLFLLVVVTDVAVLLKCLVMSYDLYFYLREEFEVNRSSVNLGGIRQHTCSL